MGWFGFWIFMAVFAVADHWLFVQGYNSFWQSHKTPAEKELQQMAIEERSLKVELMRKQLKEGRP